jgi:hypothetical protein
MDALHRAYLQSSEIASAAFVVHAIDDHAFRFYRHFDFTLFPECPNHLFLPMATIARCSRGFPLKRSLGVYNSGTPRRFDGTLRDLPRLSCSS